MRFRVFGVASAAPGTGEARPAERKAAEATPRTQPQQITSQQRPNEAAQLWERAWNRLRHERDLKEPTAY